MLASRFHSRGRYRPHLFVKVDLIPHGTEDFAGPSGGQDGELDGQRGNCVPLSNLGKERRNAGVRHSGVVPTLDPRLLRQKLVEVPAPQCRVRALSETFGPRRIQHVLDPPPQAGGRLGPCGPQRPQH